MKNTTEMVGGWESTRRATRRSNRARLTVIGLDCDGVLASDRLLWSRLRARFPEHIPARYDDLATFEWPRATAETTALCLELSADGAFAEALRPMPGMARAVRQLAASGYELRVITARPDCVRQATLRWLRRQGIADCVAQVHCVASGLDKVPLARELGCAAFVEDNHATAEALGAAGLRSYLLDAPYNRAPVASSLRMNGWPALLDDLYAHVPARRSALALAATYGDQSIELPGIAAALPALAS